METQQYVPFKARSQNYGKRILSLSCLSVRPSARKNSAPTKRIIIKFDNWRFFENVSRKFQFDSNLTRITGILFEDPPAFMKCCWIRRTRKVSNRSCGEYQNTHFAVNNFFFENCSAEKYGTVCEMRISQAAEEFATYKTQDNQIPEDCSKCKPAEYKVRRGRPKRW
jgi:hypothetical protein